MFLELQLPVADSRFHRKSTGDVPEFLSNFPIECMKMSKKEFQPNINFPLSNSLCFIVNEAGRGACTVRFKLNKIKIDLVLGKGWALFCEVQVEQV